MLVYQKATCAVCKGFKTTFQLDQGLFPQPGLDANVNECMETRLEDK